jgi:molecular chaperone DnaK
MGASVQGAIVAGENVSAVLVDITPHTLGIKTLDVPETFMSRPSEHKFAPIIRRNTPLPTSQSEVFCTVFDNQPKVEIDVYQGENPDVRRNHRVGKFLIEGLARAPAGNPLLVQLDLTLDGTLKVSAREKATGLVKQITIENAMARFAVEERGAAQERLNRLWDAPLEEAETSDEPVELGAPIDDDGHREMVQAQALIEKAERIKAKAASDDQAEIDRLIGSVKEALLDRKWDDLSLACGQLSDVLFYLEDV